MKSNSMDTIYFGHPLSEFGTDREVQLIDVIEDEFRQYTVENPNQPHHKEQYKQRAKEGSGMEYYFEDVLPDMDAGVFLPFEDGQYGAGTAAEARFLDENDRPVYEIDYEGEIRSLNIETMDVLSVEETRNRLDRS